MKISLSLILFLAAAVLLKAAEWKCDFHSPEVSRAVKKNSNAEVYRDYDGAAVLKITVPADKNGGSVSIPLPPGSVAGKKVFFEAEIAYRNVSEPVGEPWNGVKFMVPFTDEKNKWTWPQWGGFSPAVPRWGTHPRKYTFWSYTFPKKVRSCSLVLGLESSSGEVEFRNVRFSTKPGAVSVLEQKDIPKAKYDAGLPPRGRGVMSPMVPELMNEAAFRKLAEWNVNLLRWQLNMALDKRHPNTPEGYAKWVESQYPFLDQLFELGQKYGVWIIIDLHLYQQVGLNSARDRSLNGRNRRYGNRAGFHCTQVVPLVRVPAPQGPVLPIEENIHFPAISSTKYTSAIKSKRILKISPSVLLPLFFLAFFIVLSPTADF